MLHLLKRHPIPVSAFFLHSLVLTYAFPPEILQPLLPAGLVLDTYRGFAFLAVALVQTRESAARFSTRGNGLQFLSERLQNFHEACWQRAVEARIADFAKRHGPSVDGTRREFADPLQLPLLRGNLEERGREIHWTIRTPRAEADLEVLARVTGNPAPLPCASPFSTLAEARRFSGPLPYTFDYEEATHSIIGILAVRQSWNPQPVAVEVLCNTFLDQEPFCHAQPILANAFHVQDVPYQWQRGRRLS